MPYIIKIFLYIHYMKLGLYGNDDFHNGLLQTFNSGREIKGLVLNFTNKVCVCVWIELYNIHIN